MGQSCPRSCACSAVSKKRAEAARKLAAAESQWLAAQQDYDLASAEH